jgi:glycosyltransferase involved in cell wall biosynthesis
MNMKVMHLTWGETPRSYGVFGSQVISQFAATRRALPDAQFLFASGLPLIHSGMTREKFGYISECNKIRNALGDIPFKLLPIYAPQNLVVSSSTSFRWLHGPAHWHLASLIRRFEPDIVHCRSYHAAWAALSVRRRLGLGYCIVFDGRGLYPEEVALKKGYADNSVDYLYLKHIERELLAECEMSIAVSDPMEQHYRQLGARDCRTVYLSADAERLRPLPRIDRTSRPLNFCYVGALSEDTWHKPSALLSLFKRLRELIPDARLTIVTTSDHGDVRRFFSGFSETEVQLGQSRNLHQLKTFLQQADFGVMSYFEPQTAREEMLADMVLAVKTAEYLCNGLPMIVSRFCGGAASIVKRHGLGLVYDPFNLDALRAEDILRQSPDEARSKVIAEKSRNLFDYSEHASAYAGLYAELRAKRRFA